MTLGLTKGGTELHVIPHNIFSANQKAESFVYSAGYVHMFSVMCFPVFVGAMGIISSALLKCEFIRSLQ